SASHVGFHASLIGIRYVVTPLFEQAIDVINRGFALLTKLPLEQRCPDDRLLVGCTGRVSRNGLGRAQMGFWACCRQPLPWDHFRVARYPGAIGSERADGIDGSPTDPSK